jgi:hypothetical protein
LRTTPRYTLFGPHLRILWYHGQTGNYSGPEVRFADISSDSLEPTSGRGNTPANNDAAPSSI